MHPPRALLNSMGTGATKNHVHLVIFIPILLMIFVFLPLPSARAEESTKRWCEARVNRLHQVRLEYDALNCAGFYFMHQELEQEDTPFAKVLAFSLRAVELNPKNFDTQLTVLWLNYSHWVMFRENPEFFSHYENSLSLAYKWADKIEFNFQSNGIAMKQLADQLVAIGIFYDPLILPRVISLYRRSELLSSDLNFKTRCRLSVAHTFRRMGDRVNALSAYQWVLQISPNNKIAEKFIRELSAQELQLSLAE